MSRSLGVSRAAQSVQLGAHRSARAVAFHERAADTSGAVHGLHSPEAMLSLKVLAIGTTFDRRVRTYGDVLTWIEKIAELDYSGAFREDGESTVLHVVLTGTAVQRRALERFLSERRDAGQLVYEIEPLSEPVPARDRT